MIYTTILDTKDPIWWPSHFKGFDHPEHTPKKFWGSGLLPHYLAFIIFFARLRDRDLKIYDRNIYYETHFSLQSSCQPFNSLTYCTVVYGEKCF